MVQKGALLQRLWCSDQIREEFVLAILRTNVTLCDSMKRAAARRQYMSQPLGTLTC